MLNTYWSRGLALRFEGNKINCFLKNIITLTVKPVLQLRSVLRVTAVIGQHSRVTVHCYPLTSYILQCCPLRDFCPTSFPGPLSFSSLVVEERDPGCGWSRVYVYKSKPHQGWVLNKIFQQDNSILSRGGETVAVFKPRALHSVFARIVCILFLLLACPSSAFEARLVGKSIAVFCLQISLLSADYGDVILKVVVKRGLVSVPRNNKI